MVADWSWMLPVFKSVFTDCRDISTLDNIGRPDVLETVSRLESWTPNSKPFAAIQCLS
jgi:hypothetical protein